MQHFTLISLACALLQCTVSAEGYNPLRQLAKRQEDERFIPETSGFVDCPEEQVCGINCIIPSRGDVCCPENYGCPGGSFCLTQGYCCPDGLDPATCAAELGITLTSVGTQVTSLTTTSAAPTSSVVQTLESAVTSASYSSDPASSSLSGTATSSSNNTQPTPTVELFTGAASGNRGENWQWISGGVLMLLGLFI